MSIVNAIRQTIYELSIIGPVIVLGVCVIVATLAMALYALADPWRR